jgi:hypothetical protein
MTITISRTFCKVAGVVFTGFFAPLGVKLIDSNWNTTTPATAELPPVVAPLDPPPAPTPGTTRVVAQGTGPTAEAAFQNAIDTALQQTVAAEVSAAEWGRYGPYYLASVRRNGAGLLRGWRELSNVGERHLTGRVYRSEVAVDVNATALRERLRPAARP